MTKNVSPSTCVTISIAYSQDGYIALSHLNQTNEILSECLCSAEEAYEYAQGILRAYDEVINLELDEDG
jgi:hypothetical protein